jgi:NAD(P)-dependent dehydrogenase (short-subunit alcohol dehydrogenase family)
MKLQHRIALVTGSSSGIGRGVALAFAAQGAEVVINFPSVAELGAATAVAVAVRALGRQALLVQADVSVEDEARALVAAAVAAFGRVDILVNVGGLGART